MLKKGNKRVLCSKINEEREFDRERTFIEDQNLKKTSRNCLSPLFGKFGVCFSNKIKNIPNHAVFQRRGNVLKDKKIKTFY